jgi:GNAT superfamily N-acetyltransferase
MQIVNLSEKYLGIYCQCLEDWSDDIKEAGNHKELWYQKMKDKGLRAKLALENDRVCGMIQYVPAEWAFAEGQDFYFILCIWVHGHKQGIGNQQKKGMGTALLNAAEADVKALNAKGLAAWGLALPFWMKASWFKKHGYTKVDKDGIAVLMWKAFTPDAQPPVWIKEKKKPEGTPGKVLVAAFKNGWCPAQNLTFERARRAVAEFGDCVEFKAVDTSERSTYMEWGINDALFIDGKHVRTGPPPTFKKIHRKIAKRVKKL